MPPNLPDHSANEAYDGSPGGGMPSGMRPSWSRLRSMIDREVEREQEREKRTPLRILNPFAKVLVAERDRVKREFLRTLFISSYPWQVEEADSGSRAIHLIKVLHPSILLLDSALPQIEAVSTALLQKESSIHDVMQVLLFNADGNEGVLNELRKRTWVHVVNTREESLLKVIMFLDEMAGLRTHEFGRWTSSAAPAHSLVEFEAALSHVTAVRPLAAG